MKALPLPVTRGKHQLWPCFVPKQAQASYGGRSCMTMSMWWSTIWTLRSRSSNPKFRQGSKVSTKQLVVQVEAMCNHTQYQPGEVELCSSGDLHGGHRLDERCQRVEKKPGAEELGSKRRERPGHWRWSSRRTGEHGECSPPKVPVVLPTARGKTSRRRQVIPGLSKASGVGWWLVPNRTGHVDWASRDSPQRLRNLRRCWVGTLQEQVPNPERSSR